MFRFIGRIAIVAGFSTAVLVLMQLCFQQKAPQSNSGNLRPTKQVTVLDVLDADIPTPTLTRVKFPSWDYYKGKKLQADIKTFSQAPMLADLDSMPGKWRKFYPETLPDVSKRLPENPAVIKGCDGIGEYGGVWRRCDRSDWNIYRKIGYESFVRFGPSGELQPALAWKWTVENNNRVFTFYLRKGHKWSDGHPFTSKDIVWLLNDHNKWPHGGVRPDWMQTTDGRAQLYDFEIYNWQALAEKILSESESDAPSMSRIILDLGGSRLQEIIAKIAAQSDSKTVDIRLEFINEINKLLGNSSFFSPEKYDFFAADKISLQNEINRLKEKGFSLLSEDEKIHLNLLREVQDIQLLARDKNNELGKTSIMRMNLLAFRYYYKNFVQKGRLRHAEIQAVPDSQGDDSHIVRFIFERPNATFLEKTATYMFYTTIFDRPFHKVAPLHVLGSDILNTIDIYRWNYFLRAVCQGEHAVDTNTPASRLWNTLTPLQRDFFKAFSDKNILEPTEQQQIVDAINKALEKPQFYSPSAWGDIDLQSEADALNDKGWIALGNNRQMMRRVNSLEHRDDLARRFATDGPSSLSKEEIHKLNLNMFRAAFLVDAENPVVSPDREASLNRQAQSHPLNFNSWLQRYMLLWKYDHKYNNDLPTLKPWRVVTDPIETVLLAVRNPYYYKVDIQGNQLPYLDAIETTVDKRMQNLLLRLASGNVDFQVRELQFENFSYLKAHEEQGQYDLRLWANDYCGEVTFEFLQPHADPAYATLQDKPQFRHAMSMAINRQEIIDVVYNGIGTPAQYSVPEGSPYYNEKHAKMSVEFNPERANEILDSMGLDKRRTDGVRLLPDGRPLIINVESEEGRPIAVIQMVCEYWRAIGVDSRMHLRSYAYLSRMLKLGILDVRVHKEGGNYFGPAMASGFAPTHPAESVQWYNWAYYIRSGGRKGWPPPERMLQVQRLWEKVLEAPSEQAKFEAWHELSERTADDLPIIGLMTSPGKLVYVRRNFKNVPKIALAGWIAHEPGNCCPESFYMDSSLGGDKGLDKYR